MHDMIISVIVTIMVGIVLSVLTYFINKWLDSHFRR